jgi:hypothetical protein
LEEEEGIQIEMAVVVGCCMGCMDCMNRERESVVVVGSTCRCSKTTCLSVRVFRMSGLSL